MSRPAPRLVVHPLPPREIDPPPRGLLQQYLGAVATGPDAATELGSVDHGFLQDILGSNSAARQAAFHWTKHHLAVRLRQGQYALVRPSVAIRAWSIPAYYADLLTLHDVLHARNVRHAFACLTAAQEADYVPGEPILVLQHDARERLTKIEAVGYDFARDDVRTVRLEVLGEAYTVPALEPRAAAIVFASFGVPRATRIARDLARVQPPDADLAMHLNHFGVRLDKDVFRSLDPHIRLPKAIERKRREYADSLLAEGAGA